MRDRGHRRLDRRDRSPERRELVLGLRAAQLVHDAGAGPKALEPDGPAQVKRRLRPDTVADGDRTAPVDASDDPLEDRVAVVGLADDQHLALRLLAEVERMEHAREEEDGLALRTKDRAGHPAVGVRRLAEARDLALDACQVLQVGRRREEERVDALLLELLRESCLP